MRRFYVVPVSVIHDDIPGTKNVPMHNLFHPRGSVWLDLGKPDDAGRMVILCCQDFATDWHEETWHAHPEVARFPHPTAEAKVPLSDLLKTEYAEKQFKQKHLDALASIGVKPNDTVWDVHRKVRVLHPAIRLSNPY